MSLKNRVNRLEEQNGDDDGRVIVCWHTEGEECKCHEAGENDTVIIVKYTDDWPPGGKR